MNKIQFYRFSLIALSLSVSGCATIGKDYSTAFGCGMGAIVGAAIGAGVSGNVKGAVIGASIGTAVGCVTVSLWQTHQRELEKIAEKENLNLKMETLYSKPEQVDNDEIKRDFSQKDEAGFVANVESSAMFEKNSYKLTIDGDRQVRSMAKVFSKNQKQGDNEVTTFMIIGHTDATGTAEYNQKLSEQRAHRVGHIFESEGVNAENIYFQGAGSSRPIADNSTTIGRQKNRRVEIVEVSNKDVLLERMKVEQSNIKYLKHGTQTNQTLLKQVSSKTQKTITKKKNKLATSHFKGIDFGGELAESSQWVPSTIMKPKFSGIQIISSAEANSFSLSSCYSDLARVSGEVKNLATGKGLAGEHKTKDYLDGMNARAWASIVNGNLVTLSPVEVLKDEAVVVHNPSVFIVKNYNKGRRKTSIKLLSIANTYEGEDTILYRVFINKENAAVSCMDVVMNKHKGTSRDGKIFYQKANDLFVASFKPHGT